MVGLCGGPVKQTNALPVELHLGAVDFVENLTKFDPNLRQWEKRDNKLIIQTFNFVERLGHKVLDGLVPLDHEAHGGKLAASVAEELVAEAVGKFLLEPHRLEPGEGGANSKVQLRSHVNGLGTIIKNYTPLYANSVVFLNKKVKAPKNKQ
jgi:hypothetical protein